MRDNNTRYYLLGDRLGSAAVTATSTGAKYAEQRYMPWGGTRWPDNPLTPTARRYTGQIEDAAIGLYPSATSGQAFYNARYYPGRALRAGLGAGDPALGRFLQADTAMQASSSPTRRIRRH